MEDVAAAGPPADGGARGCDAARGQADDFSLTIGFDAAVFRHQDAPASDGRFAGGSDIATKTDQHAASARGVHRGGSREVGRQRLATRAQVELDPGRQANGSRAAIEANRLPTRHAPGPQRHGTTVPGDTGEIVVVARHADGLADSGIDGAAAQARRPLGGVDGGRQQWAYLDGTAAARVQSAQLAVVAESAIGLVDILQDVAHGRTGATKGVGFRGKDMDRCAQRLPALQRDHHEPPLVTVPLPLPPVLGACVADCRLLLSLLVVELWVEDAALDAELLRAVPDELEDALPAYDAAAA